MTILVDSIRYRVNAIYHMGVANEFLLESKLNQRTFVVFRFFRTEVLLFFVYLEQTSNFSFYFRHMDNFAPSLIQI